MKLYTAFAFLMLVSVAMAVANLRKKFRLPSENEMKDQV